LEERPSANRDLLLAAPVTVYQLSDKIETKRSTCMTGASFLPFVNKKDDSSFWYQSVYRSFDNRRVI